MAYRKKYKPYILKYKAHISKYVPCIFLPFQTPDSQQLTKTSKFALNSTVSVIYKKAGTFPSAFPLSKELLTLQSIRNEQINARFRHHKKNTPGTV